MTATAHDWWLAPDVPEASTGASPKGDEPGGPARTAGPLAAPQPSAPLRRRTLVAVSVVPWVVAAAALVGRGHAESATVGPTPSPALVEAAANVDGPTAAVLGSGDHALVVAAARDLVADTGGDGTSRWADHVVIEGARQPRPDLRLVAVTALTLEGRGTWTSVDAHAITVALLDGPDGVVPFAWWSARDRHTSTVASLDVLPEDDAELKAAVQEALRRSGYAAARVVSLGALPDLALLVVEVRGLDPALDEERTRRVLLDARDLHVLDDPWGDQ